MKTKKWVIYLLLSLVICPANVWAMPTSGAASEVDISADSVKKCLPKVSAKAPITWTAGDFTSIDSWLNRFPKLNMPATAQADNSGFEPFSKADIRNVSVYKKSLDKLMGPIPQNCVPLNLKIDSLDLRLTNDEMSSGNITPVTANASGPIIGYRLTPNKNIFGASPSTAATARIFYLSFNDVVGQRVGAYLLVPEDSNGNMLSGPLPAAIVFHQTYNDCGKKEQISSCASSAGTPWTSFGPEMVRRGFVTIVADMPDYGESWDQNAPEGLEYNSQVIKNILKYYPQASELGIELSYTERTLQALKTQSVVGVSDKIGAVGHSKGGTNALLAKIYFPEIKAAVVNAAGFHMFRADDLIGDHQGVELKGSPARWCKYGYLPALCKYIGKINELPLELHHMYALAVKDGALFSYQIQDDGYPKYDGFGNQMSTYWDSIDFVNAEVSRIAPKINGQYYFGVKQSGRFDTYPGAKECFEAAGSDIIKIENCLTYFGYNHGVYTRELNPFLDRMETILKK